MFWARSASHAAKTGSNAPCLRREPSLEAGLVGKKNAYLEGHFPVLGQLKQVPSQFQGLSKPSCYGGGVVSGVPGPGSAISANNALLMGRGLQKTINSCVFDQLVQPMVPSDTLPPKKVDLHPSNIFKFRRIPCTFMSQGRGGSSRRAD